MIGCACLQVACGAHLDWIAVEHINIGGVHPRRAQALGNRFHYGAPCGLQWARLGVDLDADDVVAVNKVPPCFSLVLFTRERINARRNHRANLGRVGGVAVHGAWIAHKHDAALGDDKGRGIGSLRPDAGVEKTA